MSHVTMSHKQMYHVNITIHVYAICYWIYQNTHAMVEASKGQQLSGCFHFKCLRVLQFMSSVLQYAKHIQQIGMTHVCAHLFVVTTFWMDTYSTCVAGDVNVCGSCTVQDGCN